MRSFERIEEVDLLKAIAVVLVVTGHAISFQYGNVDSPYWLKIIQNLIYSVHVPLFFVISGYLCNIPKVWSKYYYKKIKRILIPFYLFATLKLFYSFFISVEFAHGDSLIEQFSSTYLVGDVYWFCYTIFGFYILAPFFLKYSTKMLNIILGLVVVVNTMLFYWNVELTSMLQIANIVYYFFYFVLGIYLRKDENIQIVKKILEKDIILCLLVIIIVALLFIKMREGIPVINYILSIGLMGVLYKLAIIVPKKRIMKWLYHIISGYSLQIMFLDSFYKVILFKIMMRITDINFLSILVIIILNICMSCVSCRIIERIPIVAKLVGLERKPTREFVTQKREK